MLSGLTPEPTVRIPRCLPAASEPVRIDQRRAWAGAESTKLPGEPMHPKFPNEKGPRP